MHSNLKLKSENIHFCCISLGIFAIATNLMKYLKSDMKLFVRKRMIYEFLIKKFVLSLTILYQNKFQI